MTAVDVLERAREGFRGQAWQQAYASFASADERFALDGHDLALYARAAYLVGKDDDCVTLLERASRNYLEDEQPERAAECAFWLAFNLMNRGQMAQAGGWLARAEQQLQASSSPLCAVHGLLQVPVALQRLMQGDVAGALARFTDAEEIGRRCGEPDVIALAGLGIGQARLAQGELELAWHKLDEVMVGVAAGEVSPIVAGLVYCAVIIACHETYQIRRAAEWTRALSRWCDAQPGLVPFRGQCLVHRAQILQFNGAWGNAMEQVRLACRLLSDPPGQPAVGAALYEQAELHRLRGEYGAAEDAYRRAGQHGHETQPGLGLLRLAQGRHEAAKSGVRRALDEPQPGNRPRLLAAYVEIALSGPDLDAARHAADELEGLAVAGDSALLRAMSGHATGAVLLAEGDPRKALEELRRACAVWRDLNAPYLCARTRLLIGRACGELGDDDAAQIESDAAAEEFRRLAAKPDLSAMAKRGQGTRREPGHSLTPRELEVLRAVATGKSNKAIAEELFLSQKTVARHITNVFTKLGVSSRSAATAHAWEHGLL